MSFKWLRKHISESFQTANLKTSFLLSRVAATEMERQIISPVLFFSARVGLSCNSEHGHDREPLTWLPEERGGGAC